MPRRAGISTITSSGWSACNACTPARAAWRYAPCLTRRPPMPPWIWPRTNSTGSCARSIPAGTATRPPSSATFASGCPANQVWRRPNKKAASEAPLFATDIKRNLRRFRRLFLHRAGIESLGVDVAVDEFDHRHRRVVAVAEAGLDDAGIAALAVLVAGRDHIEQFPGLIEVAHFADRLPAHGKATLLAQRHQLLDDR